MDAEKVKALEKEHIMQTYGRFDLVLERGEGCRVYDAKGKGYLDFIGGIACVPAGHSNPKVAAAITEAARTLLNVSNLYYSVPQVLLAEKLSSISGLQKCFFCNSGAEANEAALKLAKRATGKTDFIACNHAFHGRTHGSLSATWKEKYKAPFRPLVDGFTFVEYGDPGAMEKGITQKTAAVIVEPIQGEAGIIVPSDDYLPSVAKICRERGVLLIVDEVQTGNGRTGKFFAYQHSGILPDIVTAAKGLANGLPIGACLSSLEFGRGEHASTFGGNNIACAAANATMGYILDNKLMENAAKQGGYIMAELRKIPNVKEVRGKGLMIGADIGADAKKIADACMRNGLLINNVTENTLRFLPPLTVSRGEAGEALGILAGVLADA